MIADGEDKMPSVGDLYALRVVNRQNLHWVVNGALTVQTESGLVGQALDCTMR